MALDTPHCEFGWKAQPFSLKDPEGKEWTLESVMGEKGLLVAFICNHCPYVKAIAERLADDARALQAEGIGVVAVMSNDYEAYPADAPAEMTRFAQQYGFPFPMWWMRIRVSVRPMTRSVRLISSASTPPGNCSTADVWTTPAWETPNTALRNCSTPCG